MACVGRHCSRDGRTVVNLRALNSLMELLGGLAVLVGLMFVGFELKQNTEAVQASTLQNLTDESQEYLLLLAQDEELNRIWRQAVAEGVDTLNESEASRLVFLYRAQWIRFQNAYLQWRRGTLDDEDWAFYRGVICRKEGDSGSPSLRGSTWPDHRAALTEGFVNFVETCWQDGAP
jgi:hypothetical protein